jgi:hypothetical protein
MTRRQLTDPFGSDDEDERFVSKWTRLSNMYISLIFISNNKPASKHPNILCNLGCILATYIHKIVKASISFVAYVCLSICMEQLGSQQTDFYEIWHLSIFQKSRGNSSFIKI